MAARAGRLGLLAAAMVVALLPPMATGPAGAAAAPGAAAVSSPGARERVARKQPAPCARPAPALRAGVPQGRRDDGSVQGAGPLWRPGGLLIRFRPHVDAAERACLARSIQARPDGRLPIFPNTWRYRTAPGVSVQSAVSFLADRDRQVDWAIPNELVNSTSATSATPNDPLVPRADFDELSPAEQIQFQWFLKTVPADWDDRNGRWVATAFAGMGAIAAWRRGYRHAGRVGIVDGGVDGAFATDTDPRGSDFNERLKPRWWWWNSTNFGGTAYRARRGNGPADFEKLKQWPGPAEKCPADDPMNCAPDPTDHGTAVASILAEYGNNGRGGSGVAQRAELIPITFPYGHRDSATLLAAVDLAGSLDLPVVNVSQATAYGAYGDRLEQGKKVWSEMFGKYPDTLWVLGAGNSAANLDVVPTTEALWTPLFSAGGDGEPPMGRYRRDLWLGGPWPAVYEKPERKGAAMLPCAIDESVHRGRPVREVGPWAGYRRGNVICVAAHRINGQLAPFSSYGPDHVEVSAPGYDVPVAGAATNRGKHYHAYGTSLAAPMVSAVAGMIRNHNRRFTAPEAKCVLLRAAQRTPLPEQNTTDVESPAFLQPFDTPITPEYYKKPLTMDFEIKHGTPRIDDGRLLRVMGIPHGGVAAIEADRLMADKVAEEEDIDTKGKRFSKCS